MEISTADQIAERFDGDGQRFEDANGVSIQDACMSADGYMTVVFDVERFDFADGSAIVIAGDAWDIGIAGSSRDCHCWASADQGRHQEGCADA